MQSYYRGQENEQTCFNFDIENAWLESTPQEFQTSPKHFISHYFASNFQLIGDSDLNSDAFFENKIRYEEQQFMPFGSEISTLPITPPSYDGELISLTGFKSQEFLDDHPVVSISLSDPMEEEWAEEEIKEEP